MIKLVALTGFARSGKDTVAHYMKQEMGDKLAVMRFASFKDNLAEIFMVPQEFQLHKKEETIPHLGKSWRYICQEFGTDFAREKIKPDVWAEIGRVRAEEALLGLEIETVGGGGGAHYANQKLVKPQCVVFTDCRFTNEAQMINREGGVVVKVSRPDNPHSVRPHASEMEMKSVDFAKQIRYNIPNTGSLSDLQRYSQGLVRVIRGEVR